jgi:hypothetical protein
VYYTGIQILNSARQSTKKRIQNETYLIQNDSNWPNQNNHSNEDCGRYASSTDITVSGHCQRSGRYSEVIERAKEMESHLINGRAFGP